jgi:hypothetical protein
MLTVLVWNKTQPTTARTPGDEHTTRNTHSESFSTEAPSVAEVVEVVLPLFRWKGLRKLDSERRGLHTRIIVRGG